MPRNHKIRDLDELCLRLSALKAKGKKIVQVQGVFDILSIGHIHQFAEAKKLGDILVVTLTPDEPVSKGCHRAVFPQSLRAEAIAALGVVDYVAVNRSISPIESIMLLKPDFYVNGHCAKMEGIDNADETVQEAFAVRSVGGDLVIVGGASHDLPDLMKHRFSVFSPQVERFLEEFRRTHSTEEVLNWLDRASSLRPVVVGEVIIDEYLFCDGIGKSTKDPVLAVLEESIEAFAGGSLAVANHLAGLCREVGLVTQLGTIERREDFVRGSLRSNIEPVFLTKRESPTICKRRVVDRYSGNKLLEIYKMKDTLSTGQDEQELCRALEESIAKWDLTVVADYGHGMLTRNAIALLCARSTFLAVNVQSNAGNRGFNPISKYSRADYVCLAGHEVAIETRQREGSLSDRLSEIAGRVDCPRFTVTQGKHGSLHYDVREGFTEAPALATLVQDRVGAGDAVLAVTSLLVKAGAPWDIVGFIGNVAGAELVAELGNRVPLDATSLCNHIASLMR